MVEPNVFLKIGAFSVGIKKNRNALGDTKSLLTQTNRLRHASPLEDFDAAVFAREILQETIRRVGATPNYDAAFAIMEFLIAMAEREALPELGEEVLSLPPDSRQAVEVREYLRRQSRFINHYHDSMEQFREHLNLAANYLVNRLPDFAFGTDEREAFLSVPLADVLKDPEEVVQTIIASTWDDDLERLSLLETVAKRFGHNIMQMSKIDSSNPPSNPHRYVYPQDTEGMSAQDLVDTYLVGTPYRPFFQTKVPIAINEQSRFEHCHILAGTGHGKTQFIQKWIAYDLEQAAEQKRSVVVIDSQGDMIHNISRLACFDPIQGTLGNRLVIIDPNDVLFPAAINMFALNEQRLVSYGPVEREKVQNAAIALYEHFFGELLGAELTAKQGVVFKYLARLMLEIPNATILTLRDLMDDPTPFIPYMDKLEGSARVFFAREFLDKSFNQTKQQISKRLWAVLSTPAFERLFSSTENKIDLFDLMNDGHVILINTAKDLLKEEGASLYGRFFLSMIAAAIMERAAIPEDDRTPTMLYIDECQDYFDLTIETLLAQGRKQKIGITLAHQHTAQLNSHERASVLANCSIKACGGINASDAKLLAQEMHTDSSYLQSMQKSKWDTEFALWIRHDLPQTIKATIPFGHLEGLPRMDRTQYERVLENNRERYSWRYVPEQNDNRVSFPGMENIVDNPQPDFLEKQSPPTLVDKPAKDTEPLSGRGGKEHRRLQAMIKSLANQNGWRADLEYPVGNGAVDVWLQQDERSIACEISITTPTDYELHNIQKSRQAGANEVWFISEDSEKVAEIQNRLSDTSNILFLTPDEVPAELELRSDTEISDGTSINGYSVEIKQAYVSETSRAVRREMLNQVLKNL